MARASASKARAPEKAKPPSSQTPASVTHEIVTGKFNETDWKLMLEKDNNEEFVAEIVDELIQLTMHATYMKYIERQLLPFTITQARDAILEIIQCQFLARDEGEPNIKSNPGWAGDTEPELAETDCWAQGSMPKKIVIEPKPLEKISEVPEDEASVKVSIAQLQEVPLESELPDAVSDMEVIPTKTIKYDLVDVAESDIEQADKLQEMKHRRRQLSLRRKSKVPAEPEVIKLTDESSKQAVDKVEVPQKKPTTCSSYIKSSLVHAIGMKDALFDEYGNVIAVPKLDPEKLPTHKVSVKFTITDPTKETELELKKKNQASTKHKSKVGGMPTEASSKGVQSRMSQTAVDKTSARQVTTPKASSLNGDEDQTIQRRSMIEEIEVAQGIIIRENGKVKKGPGRYYRKLDILEEGSIKGMKPVNLRITNPGITVADLLDRKSPILHNLQGDTPPLPPIVSQPQNQAKQMS